MFARTERLLLRPGWIEDAPALSCAIGSESTSRHLSWGRWPATLDDSERWLKQSRDPLRPALLIFSRTDAAPELVGGTGLYSMADSLVELDFWITPRRQGKGFATEAVKAMLDIAKTIGIRRIGACVFSDNPAAARVLQKLGFSASQKLMRRCVSREAPLPAVRYTFDLPDVLRPAVSPLAA